MLMLMMMMMISEYLPKQKKNEKIESLKS